jgi:hypothetical protein
MVAAAAWPSRLASSRPGDQDASGVHEAAMRAIAVVTRETPDTPAAAALA